MAKILVWSVMAALIALPLAEPTLAQETIVNQDELAKIASAEKAGTNDERLPGHADSWIALAIVITSILTALGLNAAKPNVRAIGTLLAASGCFAVSVWFFWALGSGVFGSPRPADLPTDHIKPAVLGLQASLAGVAGLVLMYSATRQASLGKERAITMRNAQASYGKASRYLHWVIALLFLALVPMGIFTSMIPEGAWYRNGYYVVHKTLGLLVLGLVAGRILWNFASPRPKLDPSLKTWERRSAHGAHLMLYFFMLAFPITGLLMSSFAGKLSHFFVWDVPIFVGPNMEAGLPFGLLHKVILPYLLYLVLGAHVIGALKHRYLDKHEDALSRMVS
ncbi:MAG: cytochrome b [Pseudomonadota bacterium]